MIMLSWGKTLVILWILILLHSSTQFIGRIDGYFNPVIDNFTIERIQNYKTEYYSGILIWGSFDKLRSCSFKDNYGIYKTNSSDYVTIPIEFLESVKVRTIGSHKFGPWFIGLEKEDLAKTKFYAVHDCSHLWDTITPMTIKVE